MRVVFESMSARVQFHVSPAALSDVATSAAWLSLASDAEASEEFGVRLAAGVRFTVSEARDGRHHVAGRRDDVAFDGWIADAAFGHVYEPAPFVELANPDGLVLEGSTLTNAAGQTLAVLAPHLGAGAGRVFLSSMPASDLAPDALVAGRLPLGELGDARVHVRRSDFEMTR